MNALSKVRCLAEKLSAYIERSDLRSAVSIPSNIAEGAERQTAKDNVRFLYFAKGSCGELVTQLMLARDLDYIPEAIANELINESIEVGRMIGGLIKYRSSQIKENR